MMRRYEYSRKWQALLTPEIVAMLSAIHEYKGEQNLFVEAKSDTLTQLVEIAKIQSTEASNKIEGIFTSDERLKKLLTNKTTPRTRNEQEIAGYRDVLSIIHESYEYIQLRPTFLLQLHRDLYKFSGKTIGGSYKNTDNVIAEEDNEGNRFVRFQPLSAWETPYAIEEICKAFDDAVNKEGADPLL
ncbi:MAG: cell filamentation protein Fic, partial [Clostridia bacterium]|nr:cell filamentation protein Fic [Clostridia bacterium]